MSLAFHWLLPTSGDSRHVVGGGHGAPVTASGGDRPPSDGHLTQVARAAEQAGFTGVLPPPTGAWCEDAWLTTAMISQHTERLRRREPGAARLRRLPRQDRTVRPYR